MARLAFLAFLPFVFVVFLVTRITIGRQFHLVQVPLVATDTLRLTVLPQQRILCLLVVVEQNFFPTLFDMAGFALRPEGTFVFVVLGVTRVTGHLQLVFIQIPFVATCALCLAVLPQQRIFGLLIVVEQNFFPAFFEVAGFALRPECALVFVVLGVARVAGHLQLVFIQIPFVATGALRLTVFPQQRILGLLVVVEQNLFPAFLDVAGFAFWPKVSFVFVVLLVTRITLLGRIFVFVADMATEAFHVHMLAQQFVIGLVVIEFSRFPIFFHVALGAIGSQSAFVFVVLLVATVADDRRIPVFFSGQMAVLALDLLIQVFVLQQEIRLCMIKLFGIEFSDAGVAPFMFGMAFLAFLLFLDASMVTVFFVNILCHIFVAIFAKSGLGGLVKTLVTFRAFAFDLAVSLDKITGRQNVRDRICIGRNQTEQA